MTQPLVTVIVPVYNGEKYLSDTLEKIFDQTYQPIEIIVIDDGSTDRSAGIVKSYPKVRYVYQENRGVAAARNHGIELANGKFIAFSDQDDLWKSEKLEKQMRYLLAHPEVMFVISKRKLLLQPGVERPYWLKEELLHSENVDYSPSSIVSRSSVFEKIGTFNPKFENASDADWFFRANDARIPKGIVPEVLYTKRIHEGNQSNKVGALHKEYLKLIRESVQKRNS